MRYNANMKKLGAFKPDSIAQFEIVEIDGRKFLIKTATEEEVQNEKFFMQTLKEHGLPFLEIQDNDLLASNQVLVEYLEDSPTLDDQLTAEAFRWWGEMVRRMHAIKFDVVFSIDGSGEKRRTEWKFYLEHRFAEAQKKTPFTPSEVQAIEKRIRPLFFIEPESPCLLHGDLHTNNVIRKDEHLVLFDKSPWIVSGDPAYDLAIVLLNFPAGTYVKTDDIEYANDRALLTAFFEGYGPEFTKEMTDSYVLFRAFERYPNHHEPFLHEIIANILSGSVPDKLP
jgi:Ser/Thr protein kinase RdoA (MazF antagonist)